MENKTFNGDNGLAHQNKSNTGFNFYYPAGGGSLNSTEEIFDYWKRTGFHYAISCREFPTFRAALIKQDNGEYELQMFDNSDNSKVSPFYCYAGKRLTDSCKQSIIDTMVLFIRKNYYNSDKFNVCYTTPETKPGFLEEIIFSKKTNADAFIATITDEGLTNPDYTVVACNGSYIG